MEQALFKPQFHGREHLNVAEWLRVLQNKDKVTHVAFELGFWGFDPKKSKVNTIDSFQAAFDLWDTEALCPAKAYVTAGPHLIKK